MRIVFDHWKPHFAADFGVSAKLRDQAEKRDTFIGTPYWSVIRKIFNNIEL